NAYICPLIKGYRDGLQLRLRSACFVGPLLLMFSHGGVGPVEEAVRVAAGTVLSGPAGGLAGGRRATAMLHEFDGIEACDLITFDVGGTSTDISLIVGGEAALSKDRTMANERIALPSLDIVTLGAGGGSIARVEAGGLLEVGPQSAGAVPGPICYGAGGTEPTVTDASVVLGFLDPDNFAGGRTRLDRNAALAAFERLGDALGIDALQAADGVHRVVNTQMAEGIRMVTVRRGVDPRRFGLLGFGGAAAMHVTELARTLGLRRVLVPRVASVLSAWGMLTTDLRLESVHSHVGETDTLDVNALRALYESMTLEGRTRMQGWFDGHIETRRSAEMRYGEQIFEIDVQLDGIDLDASDAMASLKRAFEQRHEALYTYSLAQQQPVLVNARVTTVGVLPVLPVESPASTGTSAAPIGQRDIFLGKWLAADVYWFSALGAGQVVNGPALIESESTTVLLRPGDRATTTSQRWLDIDVSG
ncbi:MAG: hydantoinase/oxoprolinase family protein, partial [Gammaproteobacteria bacterium]